MKLKYMATSLLILSMVCGMTYGQSTSRYADWECHKEIIVEEMSGVDLIDYQVFIELDSSNFDFSESNVDGSDIRFVSNGDELNYWIETWDKAANQGKIWVKLPFISANGETNLNMYYGNPGAIAMSDGNEVFDLFDDFDGNTLDENTWEYNRGKGEVKLNYGYAELKMYPKTDDNFAAELISKKDFEGNFSIHVTACARYNTETDIGVLFNYDPNSLLGYMVSTDVPSDELYGPISISINQNLRIAQGSKRLSVYPNWNTIYITRIGDEIIAEYDGEVISAVDITYKSGKIAILDDAQSDSSLLVDRILIREYASPEPVVNFDATGELTPILDNDLNNDGKVDHQDHKVGNWEAGRYVFGVMYLSPSELENMNLVTAVAYSYDFAEELGETTAPGVVYEITEFILSLMPSDVKETLEDNVRGYKEGEIALDVSTKVVVAYKLYEEANKHKGLGDKYGMYLSYSRWGTGSGSWESQPVRLYE